VEILVLEMQCNNAYMEKQEQQIEQSIDNALKKSDAALQEMRRRNLEKSRQNL